MADRISTYQVFNRGLNSLNRLNTQLDKTNEQIATGRRLVTPADDPIAASRVLELDQQITQSEQYITNIKAARGRLEQQESLVSTVEDLITRIRELTIAAGNGGYTKSDREALAAELRIRSDEILGLMNSKDTNGDYYFAGFSSSTEPFERLASGGVEYKGDEGQRYLQISLSNTVATNDNGKRLFVDIESESPSFLTKGNALNRGSGRILEGMILDQEQFAKDLYPDDAVIQFNNVNDIDPPGPNISVKRLSDGRVLNGLDRVAYSPAVPINFSGLDIKIVGEPRPGDSFIVETSGKMPLLGTIDRLAYGLERLGDGPEETQALSELVQDSLGNLKNSLDRASEVRAQIGARLNVLDSTQDMHQDLILASKGIRAELADLDYAEAVTRFSMETFILESTQRTFAKLSGLRLFDYL